MLNAKGLTTEQPQPVCQIAVNQITYTKNAYHNLYASVKISASSAI